VSVLREAQPLVAVLHRVVRVHGCFPVWPVCGGVRSERARHCELAGCALVVEVLCHACRSHLILAQQSAMLLFCSA